MLLVYESVILNKEKFTRFNDVKILNDLSPLENRVIYLKNYNLSYGKII